uniref:Serine protease n=1 Tax=Chromera velia CCMP2878 TaxID=1169474 RepID=A0A0G4I1K1_9ALVE|eukprot:Cvel_10179.t1-p1 / transcript=Cvel_10179.t1 / gene=Cvel_10179 / organism=Chromera_velia_CCMP2878 / gene_product=hypothetical protein / transcript_product=hypothetical protein / location=Cvel_scaffold608:16122-18650(+) / protein_length=643 / sequence_SO=supercontig / SO=protein_coding / is_pseudo=false
MVWDEDNRRNPSQVTPSLQATLAMVRRDKARVSPEFLILDSNTMGERRTYCDSVKFQSEPAPATCTAVLVAEDIIATAGHCATGNKIDDYFYIFGFNTAEAGNGTLLHIPYKNVYEGKEEVASEYRNSATQDNRRSDWSLIKLWRPVTDRQPVVTRKEGKLASQHVYVIGHPNGLPAKTTRRRDGLDSTSMMLNNEPNAFFEARLDTFGGNSGSPVFDAETKELEGLLVRGDSDWVTDFPNQCVRESRCPDDQGVRGLDRGVIDCDGEGVVRATEFAGVLDREHKRRHSTQDTVTFEAAAVGGSSQFPIEVPDYDGTDEARVRISFPSWHTLPEAASHLAAATGEGEGGSAPSSPPPASIVTVHIDVESRHEWSKCEMAATLRGPTGNSLELGTLCNTPFTVDGDSLFFNRPSSSSSAQAEEASEAEKDASTGAFVLEIKDTVAADSGEVLDATISFVVSSPSSSSSASSSLTRVETLRLVTPVAGVVQADSPGVGLSRLLQFSPSGAEGEAEAEGVASSSSSTRIVTDWDLQLHISAPTPPSSSIPPAEMGVELHSPGNEGGRRYRFRVTDAEVQDDGSIRIGLGGAKNERHRLFFYGVPASGVWSVTLFNESEAPVVAVREASLTVLTGVMPSAPAPADAE